MQSPFKSVIGLDCGVGVVRGSVILGLIFMGGKSHLRAFNIYFVPGTRLGARESVIEMSFERLSILFKNLTCLGMCIEGYNQQCSSSVIGASSPENGQNTHLG